MRLVEHESEFRDLVVGHAAKLPPQQRNIADYLLENLHTVPFLSVPALAVRTGASEATVVRFAQRIGYAGFSELKMDLVELLQERLGCPEEPSPEGGDVLHAVAELEGINIRRTVDGIDRATFADVADALFGAAHTFTYGMGVSAHMAELAAYTLTQVGVRSTALSTRFSSPREQLVTVRADDALLGLSFPPYSKQTLDVLADAGNRGATTVAICDRLTAPAANVARWVLPVKTDNMMFTNATAAVAVLINALATEIGATHKAHALEAFSYINRVLEDEGTAL